MSARVKKQETEPTNPEHARGIRVFVYGTLKRLHYNHRVLESADIKDTVFLGCCYIKGPYQMRNLKFYPGVQYVSDPVIKNRIYGEVYRVSEDTLKALDILEGKGSFFDRIQVETPWKKAWMYAIPPSFDNGTAIITEGVWKPNAQEKQFIFSGLEKLEAEEYFKQPVNDISN